MMVSAAFAGSTNAFLAASGELSRGRVVYGETGDLFGFSR
jgi:hypothetical protein